MHINDLLNIINKDKKVMDTGLNFILIKDLGEGYIKKVKLTDVAKFLGEDENKI